MPLKVTLPISIGRELVDHHGTMFSAMSSKISLPISIQIETSRHDPCWNGLLPDSSVNNPPLPRDIFRKPDIN